MVTFHSFFQLQELFYQWTKLRWERFWFFCPREYGPQQYSLIGTRKIQYLQTEGAHTVLGIGDFKRMDRICTESEKKIERVPV